MLYNNGQIPARALTILATGYDDSGYYEFQCTPAFAARWAYAKKYARKQFGRTLFISTGWNIYRPLEAQYDARRAACAAGNCLGAAEPGFSSHGGNWHDSDCLAIDVDANGLGWDQVDEAMAAAGFACGLITEEISGRPGGEPWHYIDFNAFSAVPQFAGSRRLFQEDDMFTDADRNLLLDVRNKLSISGADYGRPEVIQQKVDRILAGELLFPGAPYYAFTALGNQGNAILSVLGKLDAGGLTPTDIDALAEAIKAGLGDNVANELGKRLAG